MPTKIVRIKLSKEIELNIPGDSDLDMEDLDLTEELDALSVRLFKELQEENLESIFDIRIISKESVSEEEELVSEEEE